MSLKILHSADWHLGSAFSSFSPTQRQLLRREQEKIPGKIGELIDRELVDLVLLSGDLFDGHPTANTVALVKQALEDYKVPVFISPGNHDFWDMESPWNDPDWPENVHIFLGGLSSVAAPGLDCRVYGAGYQSMDCPPLLSGFSAQGQERWCVAVLHGDPVVKNSPCCPVTASQVRESGLDYLALGHIHRGGSLRAGETLCAWPGCPMGRGWDETGEKGVCLVKLDAGAELQPVVLDTPRFYDLEVRAGETAEDAVGQILSCADPRDFYRITLTGMGKADLPKLQKTFAEVPNLLLRSRAAAAPRWEEEDSLWGVYLRMLRESGDPHGELAAELSMQLLMGLEVELP